jgi:hypothetical protein
MARQVVAGVIAGVELSSVSNTYLDFSKVCGFQGCFVGMFMPLMAFSTIRVMSKVVSAIWGKIMAICAIPFLFVMARGCAIPRQRIIYDPTHLDRTGLIVQVMLIATVTILALEVLPLDM